MPWLAHCSPALGNWVSSPHCQHGFSTLLPPGVPGPCGILIGQTQVCAPAFAAKPAGKANPGAGFHNGKKLSLPLRLTRRGISQAEPGDSGAGRPLSITGLHQTPPKHTPTPASRLPLCLSPSPPSQHCPVCPAIPGLLGLVCLLAVPGGYCCRLATFVGTLGF